MVPNNSIASELNMTNDKQKLQQELKEKQSFVGDQKVKEGIKPSHLKRSKSLGDIPSAPPLPDQSSLQVQQLKAQLQKVNDD
jgi:hypothetical protein